MDLDNVIYIIATIVIFVVSLLGQKKKKAEVPIARQEEDGIYSLNDFEKILERKQEYRQPEPVIEEVENPKEIEKPKEENLKKKTQSKTQEEEENQDGFDVKSAIIYSSILERKKFRR